MGGKQAENKGGGCAEETKPKRQRQVHWQRASERAKRRAGSHETRIAFTERVFVCAQASSGGFIAGRSDCASSASTSRSH